MTIQQVKQALGSWHITLKPETPRDIIQQLEDFGHIAIIPGRINPKQYNDGMLSKARYVGPKRSQYRQPDGTFDIKGVSMAYWLGDEDDKGDVFETAVDINAQTFANSIRALLPVGGGVIEGTLTNVPGTYTGKHQYETPRKAITYVTDTYSGTTGEPVEWRVNGDGTLDAGPISALYVTTPQAILVRRDPSRDLTIRGVQAAMSMDRDVEDYTTRVVLLAEGEGATIVTADADAPPTQYNDIHGNPVISTRLVSESSTEGANAAARAQLELNRWQDPRFAVQINSEDYDVRGDFNVGDYVYAYDPDNGFIDQNNQRFYKGQVIHPVALRVIEMTWPVRANWTVAFRKNDGTWLDLSEYYKPETGSTYIMVGDFLRTLAGFGEEHIGIRPNIGGADNSIPAAPTFTGFSTGSYQSGETNTTKSALRAQWNTPLNIDGSTVQDGDHYEIRHRVNEVIGYTMSWDVLSGTPGILVDNFDRSPEAGGWGNPIVGAPWTITNGPDVNEFFTDGNVAKIEVDSVSVERAIVGGGTATDIEVYHRFSTDVLAATEDINTYVFARFIDTSNNYRLRIALTVGGGLFILCEKVVGGVLGNVGVGFIDPPAGHIAGAWYNLIFRVEGTSLRAKVWMDGEQVPVDWQFDEIDSDITGAGQTGIRAVLTAGNTNGTVVYSYDSFAAVNLDAQTSYLNLPGSAGNYASTPDAAALDIVGDIDVRAFIAPNDWTPAADSAITAKYVTTGGQRSWQFILRSTGNLRLSWSTDGLSGTVINSDSTVVNAFVNGTAHWVRATLATGTGTVTFYTSPDGVAWTQLGATVVTGATSIFSSTAPLEVGSRDGGTLDNFIGRMYRAEVRSGIAGTVVASPRFDQLDPGDRAFIDGTDLPWALNGTTSISGESSSAYDWDSLGTWDALISEPVSADPQWETKFVGWGTNAFTIMELTPGVIYELQIRGVDAAKPPNFGPWSASSFVQTVGDLLAPSTPAGPEVAASMTAVQVVHQLGRSSGGVFNLEPDIDHIDVFLGGVEDFEPLLANKIGELIATAGMLLAATPAVGTFAITPVDEIWIKVVAVDRAGNRSAPSIASPVTAELIDDAHISDLTVSKLTAGTINSIWVNAGMITTAPEGARVELTSTGIKAYNAAGQETVAIRNDGSAQLTGQVQTSVMGDGVAIFPGSQPRIRLTPADEVNAVSILKSWISGLGTVIELGNRLADEVTQHGGNLLMFEGGSILSHSEEDATDEGYLWMADDTNGGHIIRGKWFPSFTDTRGALWPDVTVVGAGFGALSQSYPGTMIGSIGPMFTVSGASPNFFWCVASSTSTGCSIAWSDALAHNIFQWIFRKG